MTSAILKMVGADDKKYTKTFDRIKDEKTSNQLTELLNAYFKVTSATSKTGTKRVTSELPL